ncbi:hypothetical protein DV872_24575 [Oceanispirochaeta sp. M1]|nr:hypothetical protein DV872_24575 [Oceanispirochaeta sp. M1]
MLLYCVNKDGEHEVHKIAACSDSPLPYKSKRIYFRANTDNEAMRIARGHHKNVDGCAYCMKGYHTR